MDCFVLSGNNAGVSGGAARYIEVFICCVGSVIGMIGWVSFSFFDLS